jgi:hypothetical protein
VVAVLALVGVLDDAGLRLLVEEHLMPRHVVAAGPWVEEGHERISRGEAIAPRIGIVDPLSKAGRRSLGITGVPVLAQAADEVDEAGSVHAYLRCGWGCGRRAHESGRVGCSAGRCTSGRAPCRAADTPRCDDRRVKVSEPLVVAWRGRQLRVRHDDPHLSPYSPRGATIRSAVELASDLEGLRLVLVSALGDRYRVRVSDDGRVVGLWRIGG